jgi:hypothetical protein
VHPEGQQPSPTGENPEEHEKQSVELHVKQSFAHETQVFD